MALTAVAAASAPFTGPTAYTGPAPSWDTTLNGSGSTADPGRTIVSYYWFFGGSISFSGVTAPVSFFGGPDVYSCTLTVTDDLGATDTSDPIYFVTDGAPPTAVIAADPTSGPVTLYVEFDGSASTDPTDYGMGSPSPVSTYAWDYGDGASDVANPSPTTFHNYVTPGTYTATLTVRSSIGLEDTDTVEITVAPVLRRRGPHIGLRR